MAPNTAYLNRRIQPSLG